jgi:hypothetical protein
LGVVWAKYFSPWNIALKVLEERFFTNIICPVIEAKQSPDHVGIS